MRLPLLSAVMVVFAGALVMYEVVRQRKKF